MKKLLFLFLSCMLFLSCSNSVEKDAKRQMEQTMKDLAKDPSSVQITDIKTMFANDSICILHFKFSAKNGFGAMGTSMYEYVYLVMNKNSEEESRLESVTDLEEKGKESVLEEAHRNYNEKFLESDSISSLNDEDRKAWHIFMAAEMHMILSGRVIGENKYDIKNW